MFVHLLDLDGIVQGQGDAPPLNGEFPTSLWEPGEMVVDTHQLTLHPNAGPGNYQIAIGWYLPTDGTRLAVWDTKGIQQADNRVLLPVEVEVD